MRLEFKGIFVSR